MLRVAAADALLLIGPTPADLRMLLRLLKEESGDTRVLAAKALMRLGPLSKDTVPQLTRMLDDSASSVQIAAVLVLMYVRFWQVATK